MSTLSPVQQRLFSFIRAHIHRHQRPPSLREMAAAVGLKAPSNIKYHLKALVERGYIELDHGAARGIRLRREHGLPEVVSVPLLGQIIAGMPVFSENVYDDIALTGSIVPDLRPLFALRVSGDSMMDAQVNEGDIVVLHKSEMPPKNGDMVAVRLTDRNEYTLKHFYREQDRVRLRPANPLYPDILVDGAAVEVQGRVVTVIRQYKQ